MELKPYQKEVLKNLASYLEILAEKKNLDAAWNEYHGEELPRYKDRIKGVPNVCLKIPTGGGKTFLACAALKEIFNALNCEYKFVVWLVPNDAILTQTTAALSNIEHPYRKKINADFQSRVAFYTKEELLQGQNISASSITENLSICVLSYASLRIDSTKKDVRKVYNENGALETLAQFLKVEEPSLINILRAVNPVVIVDESHNTKSDLSVEMLQNLNPRFILELTATPKSFSNIISVTPSQVLKAAEMIKLPVIVYNPFDKETLIESVISFRNNLEELAKAAESRGGKYIRPIALFQAAPNTKDDAETFDKIKKSLIDAGINKDEIKIKTANLDELGKTDLQDKNCAVRYIITINALKEGWDCPFAYILASLANKNSDTDVQQLVGRILRQPYTAGSENKFLNMAYVFTCSINFENTVKKIVESLNNDGVDENAVRKVKPKDASGNIDLFDEAQNEFINYNAENTNTSGGSTSRGGEVKTYKVKDKFAGEIATLEIPQFFRKVPRNELKEFDLFETGETVDRLLTPENLSTGFLLSKQTADSSFDIDLSKIDVENDTFYSQALIFESAAPFQKMLDENIIENKISAYTDYIFFNLQKWKRAKNYLPKDLKKYIRRVLENMKKYELDNLNFHTLPAYVAQFKKEIAKLDDNYRKKQFDDLSGEGKIFCQKNYKLQDSISLGNADKTIAKSLYAAEGGFDSNFERSLILKVAGLENILWWHRNSPQEFNLNGWLNHYPDFILKTTSGKIILVEAKGSYLDGDDSHEKLELGTDWTARAGLNNYNYFMVFDNDALSGRNSFTVNKFLETVKEL